MSPSHSYGILNINKPSGLTSRQVVNQVLRYVRPAKTGHAGTLDPLASGVLVVCFGAATRLIDRIQQMPKRYRATFLLGRHSPTEDLEGEVTLLADAPRPTRTAVETACGRFLGTILQRPPAFSALKVAGRRAYDLARRGETVELSPRPVTVYDLQVVAYDYPALVLEIACSAGTYVRSLGRDLAETLETVAVMSALERTAVGRFALTQAVPLEQLTAENWRDHRIEPAAAVEELPRLVLSESQRLALAYGQPIEQPAGLPSAPEYAAYDAAGRLAAILTPRGPGRLGPVLNFPPEVDHPPS